MDFVLFGTASGLALLVLVVLLCVFIEGFGYRRGRRDGREEGHDEYVRKLKFERRERVEALVEPTDQPHSRKPRGRARVSDAHMSQIRASWSEDS
jgi:hypothetical protein